MRNASILSACLLLASFGCSGDSSFNSGWGKASDVELATETRAGVSIVSLKVPNMH